MPKKIKTLSVLLTTDELMIIAEVLKYYQNPVGEPTVNYTNSEDLKELEGDIRQLIESNS